MGKQCFAFLSSFLASFLASFFSSILLLALALLVSRFSFAQTSLPSAELPQEILIIGEQPGPGLWQISKGDHVLWVMGTYSPLPKKLNWQPKQVLAALAQSQAFIGEPSYFVDVSFFKTGALVNAANRNPDGTSLQTILPADSYARWAKLRAQYHLDKAADNLRPMVAMEKLLGAAAAAEGMQGDAQVLRLLEKTAKQKKLKQVTPVLKVTLDNPDASIATLRQLKTGEIECFNKKLEQLELHLHELRDFANSWATGDLSHWRNTYRAQLDSSCASAFAESPVFAELFGAHFSERLQDEWFAAVDTALQENRSSFAVLPIFWLLRSDELQQRMRQTGWEVISPVADADQREPISQAALAPLKEGAL